MGKPGKQGKGGLGSGRGLALVIALACVHSTARAKEWNSPNAKFLYDNVIKRRGLPPGFFLPQKKEHVPYKKVGEPAVNPYSKASGDDGPYARRVREQKTVRRRNEKLDPKHRAYRERVRSERAAQKQRRIEGEPLHEMYVKEVVEPSKQSRRYKQALADKRERGEKSWLKGRDSDEEFEARYGSKKSTAREDNKLTRAFRSAVRRLTQRIGGTKRTAPNAMARRSQNVQDNRFGTLRIKLARPLQHLGPLTRGGPSTLRTFPSRPSFLGFSRAARAR